MAKKSKNRARASVNPEIAMIRSRYAEALRLGHSETEAARMAQGKDPIGNEPEPKETRAMPEVTLEAGEGETGTGADGDRRSQLLDQIPPDWQDLPYPTLKALAERLSPEAHVHSRKSASQVIEQFIAGE